MKNKFEYYMEAIKVYNEFEEGSRLWTGATNFAKKHGFNPAAFRDKFIAVKESIMKKNKDMNIGKAIAIAYNVARKVFFKKKNEMKKKMRKKKKK
jgi:hypothetical protein